MGRAALMIVAFVTLLGACAPQPFIDRPLAQTIKVEEVSVEAAGIDTEIGRDIVKTEAQLEEDIRKAVENQVIYSTRERERPANLEIRVADVVLVSPGRSFLIGGNSYIQANITVKDRETGAVIFGPKLFAQMGRGYAPGGIIGAATRPDPAQDYLSTVAAFAAGLQLALSGN